MTVEIITTKRTRKTRAQWINDLKFDSASDGCINWPFAKNKSGYGNVFYNGKYMNAHKLSCIFHNGEPTDSTSQAAHKCGNPSCVNPIHIYWASPSENNMDKLQHGTHRRGERCNLSRFSIDDVLRVRRLKKENPLMTLNDIQKLTGVKRGSVWLIVSGKTWDIPEAYP